MKRLLPIRAETPRRKARARLPPRFTTLYRSHYDYVWRCALRLGADEQDIDDLVQETFVVALRRLHEFDADGAAQPSTWLFAILRNVLRNHSRGRRRQDRRRRALSEVHGLGGSYGEASEAERLLALELLDEFLASLEPERRAVFVLAELEGHSGREVAQSLGINTNTARSRLRAARLAFTETFEGDGARHMQAAISASREAPPQADPAARRHTLQALGAVYASQLALAHSSGVSSGAGLGAWAGAAKAAALLVGAAVVGGFVLTQPREQPVEPAKVSEAARAETPRVAVARSGEVAAPEPPEPSIEISPISVAEAKPASAPRPNPGVEALETLSAARRALADARADEALALIRGVRSWPEPAISARAIALEIGALCALERSEEARERSREWRRTNPGITVDPRVDHLCW